MDLIMDIELSKKYTRVLNINMLFPENSVENHQIKVACRITVIINNE